MLQTHLTSNATWKAYDQWIEVNADKAAYTAASPENALVLIGPNRKPTTITGLTPIGLLQNFTVGQNINWQAQMMIGSGRTFFLAGKAPGNGSITRLFTSSSTLLGALYKNINAVVTGPSSLSAANALESPAYEDTPNIMFTMDTELLKIPFGMACLFRDTVKNFIGGFYVESVVIPNLNLGFAVGQPAIFETVNIMFDRVVPFDIASGFMSENTITAGVAVPSTTQTAFDAAIQSEAV